MQVMWIIRSGWQGCRGTVWGNCMKSKKVYIIITGLLFFILAGFIVAYIYIYKAASAKHGNLSNGGSLPEEYIVNGIDVSGQSITEAQNIIKNILGSKQVDLCGVNTDISRFTDIDIKLRPDDIDIYSYIINSGSTEVNASYKVNKKKLKDIIKDINCTEPQNAQIGFTGGKAVIIPEVYGNSLKITDEVVKELENCLLNNKIPDLSKFYKQPGITSSDLEKSLKKASKWNNYKIEINTEGFKVKLLDASKHLLWNGKKVTVPGKWIKKEVNKLSKKLDTYDRTRTFITNGGEVIKVPGGTMGWKLNKDKTKKAIKKAVKGNKKKVALVWDNMGAVMWDSKKGNDIGNTYVEVSLKEQKVWYYNDGELELESSTVTGLPTIERQTKTGVHHILYKQRDRILRGSAGAWNSFVSCWMPFTWDGQGLHDASWRNSFGGSIYLYNGSHGCVNLPVAFASQLYEKVETGTPVIVY